MRRTKIVATAGPATQHDDVLRDLIAAGVDIFRLNFSHGTHRSHGETIARVRALAAGSGRCVSILQDLSGPKIRTGSLRDGIPLTLRSGDELLIETGDAPGAPGRVTTTFADLAHAVRPGDTLLLDDGHIQLRVHDAVPGRITTVVVDGGTLGEHKGINAPGVQLPTRALTAKDIADLRFGVTAGVDWIALSFVRSADDIRQARQELSAAGAPAIPIIAKLERPEAIAGLEEILREADGVMIARGDLGLEVPLEQVPRIQKAVTRRARALGVPVIVATQVLDSMIREPRPTRAEVSDAANAVDDGVDAIMLAGETAAGAFPVKTVETLELIIRDAEGIPSLGRVPLEGTRLLGDHGRAICEAAVTLAESDGAAAIVAVTREGKTARLLSALRPHVPIFAATDDDQTAHLLTMMWGVMPVTADLTGDVTEAGSRIGDLLVERGIIPPGSAIVLVSITPDLGRGPSNFLKLQRA